MRKQYLGHKYQGPYNGARGYIVECSCGWSSVICDRRLPTKEKAYKFWWLHAHDANETWPKDLQEAVAALQGQGLIDAKSFAI